LLDVLVAGFDLQGNADLLERKAQDAQRFWIELPEGMIGIGAPPASFSGGCAIGLSATNAWAQGPLSVISGLCAYSRGSASHFKGP
jgi:hypothetical protein